MSIRKSSPVCDWCRTSGAQDWNFCTLEKGNLKESLSSIQRRPLQSGTERRVHIFLCCIASRICVHDKSPPKRKKEKRCRSYFDQQWFGQLDKVNACYTGESMRASFDFAEWIDLFSIPEACTNNLIEEPTLISDTNLYWNRKVNCRSLIMSTWRSDMLRLQSCVKLPRIGSNLYHALYRTLK